MARIKASAWLPVAACAVVVFTLGMAKVSGSSVSLYGEHSPAMGQARPIRSDEYTGRTPLVVRQVNADFPTRTIVGNGVHDTGVLSDLPERSWATVLRPHTIPYLIFGVERAFAFEWWITLAMPFLGVYWLIYTITRRIPLGVLAGLAAMLAPAVMWWSQAALSVAIGAATAACAALVHAGRAATRPKAALWGAAAGWAFAMLATQLYAPWTLGMAIVTVPLAATCWITERRRRDPRVTAIATLVPLAAVAMLLVAGFLMRHRDALTAIANTVYPGDRRSKGGQVTSSWLFSAPFDYFTGRTPIVGVNGTNQSEFASSFVLWLPVLVANMRMVTWWRDSSLVRRACAAVSTSTLVLLVWAYVPLPAFVAHLTLLDRIPAERLSQSLMLAGVLLGALAIAAWNERVEPLGRVTSVAAVALTAGLTCWAGLVMRVDQQPISRVWVVIITAVIGLICWLFVSGRGVVALSVMVVFTATSTVRINPVQVGLAPLIDAPLMHQIATVDPALRAAPWLEVGEAPDADGVLTASGVPLLSGLSWYPDDPAWLRVDPARQHAQIWNRLAHVRFELTADTTPLQFSLPYPDVILLSGGVCSDGIRALEPGVIVSDVPLDAPCVQPVGAPPTHPGELLLYAYRRAG